MGTTTGLADTTRTAVGIIVTALIAINASLAGLAATNQVTVPPYVYFALGIAVVVVQATKDQLGIRDSTTAKVSKTVDPQLHQERRPSASQLGSIS